LKQPNLVDLCAFAPTEVEAFTYFSNTLIPASSPVQ